MRIPLSHRIASKTCRNAILCLAVSLAPAERVYAQGGPRDQAQTAFTGTIAAGLALVAIILGGLMLAFGESAAKRTWRASSSTSAWPWGPSISCDGSSRDAAVLTPFTSLPV